MTSREVGIESARLPGITAAARFKLLWDELSDLLGSAAAAALLRRAAKRAAQRHPELAALTITRDGFEYQYKVPPAWGDDSQNAIAEFCELARQFRPLLVELTGSVVLRRLSAIPELETCGLDLSEDDR